MAVLLVRVRDSWDSAIPIHGWIDSRVALCWIRAPAERWKPFVRNRVYQIQELSVDAEWSYVSTKDNPADLISRGCNLGDEQLRLWWMHWPSWLSSPGRPAVDEECGENDEYSIRVEEREVVCNNVVVPDDGFLEYCGRFSSWDRLCGVTALILRFAQKCRKAAAGKEKFATVKEKEWAAELILKKYQEYAFAQEIADLSRVENSDSDDDSACFETKAPKTSVSRSSALKHLAPFLDESGVMRVYGRLQNSDLPFARRHPIIIPGKGVLTEMIIDHFHGECLHGGVSLTLAQCRQLVWIVRGQGAVRARLHTCVRCRRVSPRAQAQLMGNLPLPRVQLTRAFQQSGCDFAGPFRIKTVKGRGGRIYKAYIAVFVVWPLKRST